MSIYQKLINSLVTRKFFRPITILDFEKAFNNIILKNNKIYFLDINTLNQIKNCKFGFNIFKNIDIFKFKFNDMQLLKKVLLTLLNDEENIEKYILKFKKTYINQPGIIINFENNKIFLLLNETIFNDTDIINLYNRCLILSSEFNFKNKFFENLYVPNNYQKILFNNYEKNLFQFVGIIKQIFNNQFAQKYSKKQFIAKLIQYSVNISSNKYFVNEIFLEYFKINLKSYDPIYLFILALNNQFKEKTIIFLEQNF